MHTKVAKGMAEVKLEHITKIFPKGVIAIKDIDLYVKDKEFLVLVGPSGCGKSTVLRIIAGLEEPTYGKVFIGGKDMTNVQPKNRNVAMVFQNYALYPHMTVFENMAFGLKLKRIKKEEIRNRIITTSKILGIDSLLNRKPKELSGGEKQRVAVGRAIVRNPSVFLFDEPLSNLDAKLRVQMRAELAKLHNRLQTTMIYVTHDQTEAMTMGDRIAVIQNGEIQQIDEPITLYNNPQNIFVASFIGSPAMNLLAGEIQRKEKHILFVSGSIKFILDGKFEKLMKPYINKKIIWGIRPEDLIPTSNDSTGTFAAVVSVVEPMGNEIFLYLYIGENEIVARVKSTYSFKVNEKIFLQPTLEKSHFFETGTGKRIVSDAH